jgi:hypothetical protein
MTELRSHTCTSCKKVTYYENVGSWRNAKTKLNRTGILRCPQCAGKEGREASSKEIPGRTKGSKTRPELRSSHSRPGAGKRLNNSLTKEQRMKGIAKRNGYETYEQYQATLSDWEKYKNEVWRITNQQPLFLLENFDKRGQSGIEGAYQIDHMYSILKGFKSQIPPALIGDIKNLQMLPWLDNLTKGWK